MTRPEQRPSMASIEQRRAQALATRDGMIDRITGDGSSELTGGLFREAVLLRAELRTLHIDWRTVADTLAEIERRLGQLERRLP